MKPRIAIPVPTSNNEAYNALNWKAYAAAMQACGGEPVRVDLELSPREIADLAGTCQGLLLPGSPADVNPAKYGQSRDAATAPADQPRENVDELLLQDAHNLHKPILGICFGAQMLNVWRSGTLVQDLTVLPVNHAAARGVAVAHTAALAGGSLLSSIVEEASREDTVAKDGLRFPVNSSHHQAIGIPGDGLRVTARCPQDGVVEAVEGGQKESEEGGPTRAGHPGHFVLGIQWHPERTFASDAISRALFQRFVLEARHWAPRIVSMSVAG